MGDDRVERRGLLAAGAGLLASLTGCSGLFIEPEGTGTPGEGDASTATPTVTPTATATPTVTPTATATTTPAPIPSEDIDVRNRRLSVRRTDLEAFAIVTYQFDVENVSDRTIGDVEFRVRVRYDHGEFSRIVATDYPRFRFDGDGDEDDGLDPDETVLVAGDVRFERDGRSQGSTAADRFDLELTIRRIRHP
jgi:hypothetical protein